MLSAADESLRIHFRHPLALSIGPVPFVGDAPLSDVTQYHVFLPSTLTPHRNSKPSFISVVHGQELTRWSLLTDEACNAVMSSTQRLIKTSAVVMTPYPSERQSSDGGTSGSESNGSGHPHRAHKSSAKRMLGRLSLGGSRKTLADVFAVEPPSPPAPLRHSSSSSARSFGMGSPSATLRDRGSAASGGGNASGGGATRSASRGAEKSDRRALFGERERDEDDGNSGVRSTLAGRADGGVSGVHAAVSEAHDLAVQRGEKLESMVDKSRQLEDSALAFGDMAKQLRRQQEDEACCVS